MGGADVVALLIGLFLIFIILFATLGWYAQ